MFPKINWHSLDKERVDRGIRLVREQLPNMLINSERCGWIMECFQNYEYKRLEKADDWAAKPMHNKYSHMMDALRYAAMGLKEIQYFNLNDDGAEVLDWNMSYEGVYDDNTERAYMDDNPIWMTEKQRKEKRSNGGIYYYE